MRHPLHFPAPRIHEDQHKDKDFRVERAFSGNEELFGLVGTCVYADLDSQELSLMDQTASIKKVKLAHVIELTKKERPMRALKTFQNVSKQEKQKCLGRLGMHDPETAPPVEVSAKGGLVDSSMIQMYSVLLEHTFGEESWFFWPPDAIEGYFEHVKDQAQERQEKFEEGIRKALVRFEKVFFPIHCPQSTDHKDGHWTLLVVQAKEAGETLQEPKVRYYDSLDLPNEVCLSRADQLLSAALPQKDALWRHKSFDWRQAHRQSGTECGFWLMHFLELEVRQLAGEGSTIRTPKVRKDDMKRRTENAGKMLEKYRIQWQQDARREEEKFVATQKMLQAKTTQLQLDLLEATQLRARAENAARVSFWMKSLPDVVPEDPREFQRRLKAEENQAINDEVQKALRKIFEDQAQAASQKRSPGHEAVQVALAIENTTQITQPPTTKNKTKKKQILGADASGQRGAGAASSGGGAASSAGAAACSGGSR